VLGVETGVGWECGVRGLGDVGVGVVSEMD